MKKNKSSKNWIIHQHRDQYFKQAKSSGFRSRSAYKLLELDKKFKIFKNCKTVIDLGSYPGGWAQMLKKNLKLVDRVHCISKEIKKDLIKLNFPKKKILEIPNCIYFEKFHKYKAFRPKLLTLITVARYAEKKKGFDFVEKIGRCLLKKIQFKWVIIGRNVSKLSKNEFISKHRKNLCHSCYS